MAQKKYDTIELWKLHRKLEEVINRVRFGKEAQIVTSRGEPLVRITPVTGHEHIRRRRAA